MAKLAFSKLGLTKNTDVVDIIHNEQSIEVKQYLPVNDKLTLISNVINNCQDPNIKFMNPIKRDIFMKLEIVFFYTNISFTEKQKEDIPKLYDLLNGSGLLNKILRAIPAEEYKMVADGTNNTIKAIYKYQHSALGIMDSLSTDYKNLELDANKIKEQLGNTEDFEFLKEVMAKMGV